MKLSNIKISDKHVHLSKKGEIPLSDNAPYDFEDGDTSKFKELPAFPKKPFSHEQISRAMIALHKMIERQSKNYSKGKLFKAGIVVSESEQHDDREAGPDDLVNECYELLKHLHDVGDDVGVQMFMSIVSEIIEIPDDSEIVREDVEPSIPKADAYGGVLIHGGKVLLREPTNHFGGYVWTFAKGRVDEGEDPTVAALREVFEETGYHAKITHVLPTSYGGSTSSTGFFIMVPVGEPEAFGWETQSIKWVSYDEAVEMINQTTIASGRRRDLQVLHDAFHGDRIPLSNLTESKKKLTPQQYDMYARWRKLVNMTPSALQAFKESQMKRGNKTAGEYPGLRPAEARKQGISSGVQSAVWIIKMKQTSVADWSPEMWRWCGKQISFISRMKGSAGKLRDADGNPTRKLLSLKIWGHNPEISK